MNHLHTPLATAKVGYRAPVQFIVTPARPVKGHFDATRGVFVLWTTCPICHCKGEGEVFPDADGLFIDRLEKMANYMHSDQYECRTCREWQEDERGVEMMNARDEAMQ